tara:strand:- start:10334 stop:11233 length:900 start_codon:yes stop_codon:yes gene_type:complete
MVLTNESANAKAYVNVSPGTAQYNPTAGFRSLSAQTEIGAVSIESGLIDYNGFQYNGSAVANSDTGLLGVSTQMSTSQGRYRLQGSSGAEATIEGLATIGGVTTTGPQYVYIGFSMHGSGEASGAGSNEFNGDLKIRAVHGQAGHDDYHSTDITAFLGLTNLYAPASAVVGYNSDSTGAAQFYDSYNQINVESWSPANMSATFQLRVLLEPGDTLSFETTLTARSARWYQDQPGAAKIDALHTGAISVRLPQAYSFNGDAGFLSQGNVTTVPEPASLFLMLGGLGTLVGTRSLRFKRQA